MEVNSNRHIHLDRWIKKYIYLLLLPILTFLTLAIWITGKFEYNYFPEVFVLLTLNIYLIYFFTKYKHKFIALIFILCLIYFIYILFFNIKYCDWDLTCPD